MKRQLYLYLFILTALVAAFTYMYFSKAIAFEKKKNESELKYFKDSITEISNKLLDADHFSLENNDYAKEYFVDYDLNKLMPQIKEALLAYNDDPKGNIYTGQEKLGEQKFIINKIKILNHRWIIAGFSDGENSGEVLLKYFVKENYNFTFETNQSLMFPKK